MKMFVTKLDRSGTNSTFLKVETLPRDAFDASANSAAYWREHYLLIDISSFAFDLSSLLFSGDRGPPNSFYFLPHLLLLSGNLLL